MMLVDEGTDGSSIVNKLNLKKGSDSFTRIKTHEHAQLMPMFRLFKVYRHKGKESSIVEFEFSNFTSLDGIAKELTVEHLGYDVDSFGKGAEVGVKSFEWRNLGTDPFTATRDIEATLKVHAQHFPSLAKMRKGKELLPPGSPGFHKHMSVAQRTRHRVDPRNSNRISLP
jgi:hypothetical protein